jgi:hypothetical protein
MVDTPRVFAEKQIVSPLFVTQSFGLQRAHNMGFATVAVLFFFAIFATMGAVNQ